MSRKQPSFRQIIGYIEKGANNAHFSVYHNIYSRDSEAIKAEFKSNAENLKARKNGVFLYHEILSITRAEHLDENTQKALLQQIVHDYLHMRASKNLAYAVLHEDKKDNLHFHLIISANEIESQNRHRLSREDFAQIQIQLERMVLQKFPELEQRAVFEENQTPEQKRQSERKGRISKAGAELHRRTGATPKRDDIKATIEKIFQEATDGRHFTELLEKHRLKLYQRGKNHGIIADDGTKYRFNTLGLADAWELLDKRMMAVFERQNQPNKSTEPTANETTEYTEQPKNQGSQSMKDPFERKPFPFEKEMETIILGDEAGKETSEHHATSDPMEDEAQKRRQEMEKIRQARAEKANTTKQQDKQP